MRPLTKTSLVFCITFLLASSATAQLSPSVAGKLDSLEARIRMLESVKSQPIEPATVSPPRMTAEDSIAEATIAALEQRIATLAEKLSPAENPDTKAKPSTPAIASNAAPAANEATRTSGTTSGSAGQPPAVTPSDRTAPATAAMTLTSSVEAAPQAAAPVSTPPPTPAPRAMVATIDTPVPSGAPIPAPTQTISAPKVEKTPGISLKPGRGFTIESPDNSFSLQPGGRIQFRHSLTEYDHDRGKTNLSNFSVERFEIWLSGKAFTDWGYKFEANFGKGNVRLGDGYVEWSRYDALHPKMGQFKVMFDRQMKTSSSEQEFVDRSAPAKTFGIESDIGLQFYGGTKDKKLQYNAGIFNGEGENKSNTGAGELAVIRLSANPNGDFGWAESDTKGTKSHLWVADAAVAYNASSAYKDWSGDGTIGGRDDEANVLRLVGGLGYRHAGLFAQGEYFHQTETPKLSTVSKVRANGWYAQMGYMIVPASWEVAARYGIVDPDAAKSDNLKREATIGVNHFLMGTGHAMKLAADITLRTEDRTAGKKYNDIEVRTQVQLTY